MNLRKQNVPARRDFAGQNADINAMYTKCFGMDNLQLISKYSLRFFKELEFFKCTKNLSHFFVSVFIVVAILSGLLPTLQCIS